jgi:hypothetical protein
VSVKARRGGPRWRDPVDRGKPGSKNHLLIDASGVPLAVGLSGANTHDSQLLEQLVDAVPVVIGPRGRLGRPLTRPTKQHADKGYDFPTLPPDAAPPRYQPADRSAWSGIQQAAGPPPLEGRAVVAWLLANRHLTVRYERRADILRAFLPGGWTVDAA